MSKLCLLSAAMSRTFARRFRPGDLIQPRGQPEFAGRIVRSDGENHVVRGCFARHVNQTAWEFSIPKAKAQPFSQSFGYPQPV